jgi:hypothetical protein
LTVQIVFVQLTATQELFPLALATYICILLKRAIHKQVGLARAFSAFVIDCIGHIVNSEKETTIVIAIYGIVKNLHESKTFETVRKRARLNAFDLIIIEY